MEAAARVTDQKPPPIDPAVVRARFPKSDPPGLAPDETTLVQCACCSGSGLTTRARVRLWLALLGKP